MTRLTGAYAFFAVLLFSVVGQSVSTHFMYMTSHCSHMLEVNTSLVLALTPDVNLGQGRDRDFVHCAVDLRAQKGGNIMAHFLQMSISPDMDHSDRLNLFEPTAEGRIPLTPAKGLYGKLERSLMMFDDSGRDVKDYVTSGNRLQLDYLGKPSQLHPGFRVLLTSVTHSESGGSCPKHWVWCKHVRLCVPRSVWCDGYHNCGKDDLSDERGCERADKVTDLLEDYSLEEDIILRVLFPLFAFLLVVAVALCFAQRYNRRKFAPLPPQDPQIRYNTDKEIVSIVQQDVSPINLGPPSYDHVMRPVVCDPPPAYSSLISLAEAGAVVIDSGEESASSAGHGRRRGTPQSRQNQAGGGSGQEGSPRALTHYERYLQRKHDLSDSESEDEEARKRRRKKGGKNKSKGKQESSSQSSASPSVELSSHTESRQTPSSLSSLHGLSPLAVTPERRQQAGSVGRSPSSKRSPQQSQQNGKSSRNATGKSPTYSGSSSSVDKAHNGSTVLSSTTSSPSTACASVSGTPSPEYNQEFIPIHRGSGDNSRHSKTPQAKDCPPLPQATTEAEVGARRYDNNNLSTPDTEEPRDAADEKMKNGHVNGKSRRKVSTIDVQAEIAIYSQGKRKTAETSQSERAEGVSSRINGSNSGDFVREEKINGVAENGVSHNSVEQSV